MNKLPAILLLALSLPALAAVEVAGMEFEGNAKVGAGDTAIDNAAAMAAPKPRLDQVRKNMLSIGTAAGKSAENLGRLPGTPAI